MHPPSQQGNPGTPHAVHVPASAPHSLPAMQEVVTPSGYVTHTPPSPQLRSLQQGRGRDYGGYHLAARATYVSSGCQSSTLFPSQSLIQAKRP
jgi:hypothetical protein